MPKQTDKELGLFFKNARHEQKLTYEELAEKAEMSSRYLKEIENGGRVPSFHKIRKLVRALNVPPEPLFYPIIQIILIINACSCTCQNATMSKLPLSLPS